MTEADEGEATSQDVASETFSLLKNIATELWRLNEAKATGELAALRRMDRRTSPPAAFFRVLARAGAGEMGLDAIHRWARAVAIMAQRPDALKATGLGETLKSIGVSEQRLDLLLYSRGPGLYDLALRTAKRIARSEDALPYRDLCHLVLYESDASAEDVRIRIAQSYLRASGKTNAAATQAAPLP